MEIKGVITGDIINSTGIKTELRETLLNTIQEVVRELEIFSTLRLEFFRGDSFQIIVDKPAEALIIAVLLRAGLKSHTPKESKRLWDARISLGIGDITYSSEKVVVSDGEAFHYSGWEFDELGKRKLAIRTTWNNVNNELKVSTAFADDIISRWSKSQAQVIYVSLLSKMTQKDIDIKLNKTTQNISKLLSAGKESLICLYLERYKQIISK
ncbi:MAG: hypothetical protein RR868_05880 [Muribaculaceae bacterium]